MSKRKQLVIPSVVVSVVIIFIVHIGNEVKRGFRIRTETFTEEPRVKKERPLIKYIIPDDEELQLFNKTQLVSTAHRYTDHLDVYCEQPIRVGSVYDGGKHLCVDDPVKPTYNQCLVYSFGSKNDFSFESSILNLFGCETHTFDPFASGKGVPKGCIYHHIGLDGKNHKGKHVNFMTLKSIMKELKHTKRVIDVLKVDIEKSEWNFLEDVLDGNLLTDHIKQLLMEIHLPFKDIPGFRRALSLLRRLREKGFLVYSRERNVICRPCVRFIPELNIEFNVLTEFCFLNSRYLE